MSLLTVEDVTADTRARGNVITSASLGAVWPEVSHRLGKLLTSRGAPFDVVDDVVQEVAARALARRVTFTDAGDLMRWAVPVALNLLVDNARAARRVTYADAEPPESVPDVAELVVHRDRVGRVLHAVATLSPADRAALTGPDETPADRREAVKLAVRRHRARRRLLALVDGVAGLLVGLLRRLRAAAPTAAVAMALPVAFVVTTVVAAPHATMISEAGATRVETYEPVAPAAHAAPRARVPAPVRATRVTAPRKAAPAPRQMLNVGDDKAGLKVQEREPTQQDGLVCVRHLDLPPVPDFCVLGS